MNDDKPFKTIDEQLNILQERKLIIEDKDEAKYVLSHINYYRLSGYTLTVRKNDEFYEGIKFSDIMQIYNFDSELRTLLMHTLETIEVDLRTHIAYMHGEQYGPYGYLEDENFNNKEYHAKFMMDFEKAINDSRNEVFVKHHNQCHEGKFPIWVAVEMLTFGAISKFYTNIDYKLQKKINKEYYFNIPFRYIENWMRCFTILRNMCAHRARLYNRGLPITLLFSDKDKEIITKYGYDPNEIGKSVFFEVVVLDRIINNKSLRDKNINTLDEMIKKYPFIKLSHYGFKANWKEVLKDLNSKYYSE